MSMFTKQQTDPKSINKDQGILAKIEININNNINKHRHKH